MCPDARYHFIPVTETETKNTTLVLLNSWKIDLGKTVVGALVPSLQNNFGKKIDEVITKSWLYTLSCERDLFITTNLSN